MMTYNRSPRHNFSANSQAKPIKEYYIAQTHGLRHTIPLERNGDRLQLSGGKLMLQIEPKMTLKDKKSRL